MLGRSFAQTLRAVLVLAIVACSRRPAPSRPTPARTGPSGPDAAAIADARAESDASIDASTAAAGSGSVTPKHSADAARVAPRVQLVPFAEDRQAYVVMPEVRTRPARLLAMIHGACTGPSYVCGAWASAASEVGLLVCPTGNTTCGPEGTGPPTWEGPFTGIDTDLELSIAAVRQSIAVPTTREGAILVGYSRGAYAAVILAVRHPGRWPFLVLNEADVDLTVPMLRAAGVRSVALIAGEWGTQIAGERRTAETLAAEGYPVRLWEMPKVGHPYSADIEAIMRDALAFVLASAASTTPPAH